MENQNPFQQNLSEFEHTTHISPIPSSEKKVQTGRENSPTGTPGFFRKNKKIIYVVLGITGVMVVSVLTVFFGAGTSSTGALNKKITPAKKIMVPSQEVIKPGALPFSKKKCEQIQTDMENLNHSIRLVTDESAKKTLQAKIDELQKQAFEDECKVVTPGTSVSKKLECPPGQTPDNGKNQCVCNKQNGFYPITIQNAIATSISANPDTIVCLSCDQMTARLTELEKSTSSTNTSEVVSLTREIQDEKAMLTEAAKQNSCNLCGGFDEKIKNAFAAQQWADYYKTIQAKADDKMCGRNFPACDTFKWKLIFTLQMKTMLSKDLTANATILSQLNAKIKEFRGSLLQNSCVDIPKTCSEIAKNIDATELSTNDTPSEIDLTTFSTGQLFLGDRVFKIIHCKNTKAGGFKRAVP